MIALTPGGRMLDDAFVDELAAEPAVTLLCGRYEGFDERIVQHFASDARLDRALRARPAASSRRWSSATPCCASCRARSATPSRRAEESFSAALGGDPEYPHYTRPAEYRGWRGARRSCCPATTRRSAAGARAPRAASAAAIGPGRVRYHEPPARAVHEPSRARPSSP